MAPVMAKSLSSDVSLTVTVQVQSSTSSGLPLWKDGFTVFSMFQVWVRVKAPVAVLETAGA